mmetsp:Transcript_9290/g.15042  ORF Transcript_9290/g.15042 Transcript_9290/m.15042 type:complete len:95 (+) Transcript_9290:154-438(+)|eukprot:CAMPEP_0197039838 /NCGR_PEP_ID=MMETSP1384-20130603/16610_1 /TAXON_ID=29189 /ORGANISM="Ammonia sp." /LENGTH=94 /DNA_ID=CAMNT_0042470499 /DNA_START=106 /DNA_END=390 /DNA_ORIENTATION=+
MAAAGGWNEANANDAEDMNDLNATALAVKDAVEAQAAKDKKPEFTCYSAVGGARQVVAGMNYKIKIKVGDDRFVEIKVYRSLPPVSYELKSVTY